MPQTDTFTYRHTRSQPGPPAAALFWLASFSHLLQVALVKRLWKKRQIYCLSFFVERCRKPLYLVSDWFVHLPIKYLVNEKKKQQKRASHWQWKLRWAKNGASIGYVQYLLLQAILIEAMYKPESMAQAGWMTFSILFEVLLIKLIIAVGNKFWCRFRCIQYSHCSHICVENKKMGLQ